MNGFVASITRISTGQIAFEGGIDGGRIPLLLSPSNPQGLKPNQLSWLVNGTVRGGGISPRAGWYPIVSGWSEDGGLFQGSAIYVPDYGFPYIMFCVSGHIYRCRVDTDNSIEDLTVPGQEMNPVTPKVWFCQGEQFMIIQDGQQLPHIWDGTAMYTTATFPGAGPAMLQVGTAMDYYMGRLWVASGRKYYAGDIVLGTSGTALYQQRDAILHNVENTYLNGGGSFIVPTFAGDIRAMAHTSNLDTALGEGQLFVFTRNTIYSVNVTPDRTTWAALSEPLQRVAQQVYGAVSDRAIVKKNGDLFYQSYDGVRSLMLAIRYFHQWGQTAISSNENRLLKFNDRALLRFASGIEFDNRLLQTALPVQTPVGVGHQAIMPLDFDLLDTIDEKIPPVWEGHLEGLDHLQLIEGDWGGLQRAFSFVHSRVTGKIELWEFSQERRFESNDKRNTMVIEFPGYHFDDPMQLKQLDNAELWLDELNGTVDFELFYRPNQYPCWIPWYAWSECSARSTCEDVENPVCYPESRTYCDQDRITIVLPKAPAEVCDTGNGRPTDLGYSFQIKLKIKGWARVRGLLLWAWPREREPYSNIRNTT